MERKEQDITNNPDGIVEDAKRDGSDNSYSVINTDPAQDQQENFFYDELDRKCTLKKSGTIASKIILHRQRTHYKGKTIYDISTALLGIIGIVLLIIYIIICARGGWSMSDIYDVSSGKKIALLLLSVFIIFISGIGLLGTYTYWKPIILMTTLLSFLAFVSHCYVAKQFLDITRFPERDMAQPWWDTYTDEQIMAIEEKFNCCGYLDYNDHGFASKNCPKELVTYTVPQDIYLAAKVKKNDSYQKKYWRNNQPTDGGMYNTTIGYNNPAPNPSTNTTPVSDGNTNGNTNTATKTPEDTTSKTNTGSDETKTDETKTDETKTDETKTDETKTDETKTDETKTDEGKTGGGEEEGGDDVETWRKRSLNIIEEDASEKEMKKLGEEIKNSLANGQGKIVKISKRQEATTPATTTPATTAVDTSTIPGCKKAIADKVKSGVTPLYIGLFACLIVYVLVFVSSFIYWSDLRNEKEYDEFS